MYSKENVIPGEKNGLMALRTALDAARPDYETANYIDNNARRAQVVDDAHRRMEQFRDSKKSGIVLSWADT